MHHWDDLKYVLALEQQGNLIKAATQLKTNPTTVSRHIKRISETYQRTLFTRKNNGEWELTKDGQNFAETAKHCQAAIDELTDDQPESTFHEVTVSTIDFLAETVLAPHINELDANGDGLVLTLDTQDRNVSLAFGEADLAIRMGRPKSGRLIVSKLGDCPMGVFSRSKNPCNDWVGLPTEYDWVPEMRLGFEHFGCPPVMRAGTFSSIHRIALESGLSCIGPENMFEGWRGFHRIDGSSPAHREIWCVVHETRRKDPILNQVRDWAKSCFSPIANRRVA